MSSIKLDLVGTYGDQKLNNFQFFYEKKKEIFTYQFCWCNSKMNNRRPFKRLPNIYISIFLKSAQNYFLNPIIFKLKLTHP